MAIKKSAFDLYTQERQLPSKKPENQIRGSHFFDDIDKAGNGSQTVHKRFTPDETAQQEQVTSDDNGSQTVHKRFTSSATESVLMEDSDENKSAQKKPTRKATANFSQLAGNQLNIIIALYKNMKINKTETTEELTLESIASLAGVNQKSLKNTLFRLRKNGFISLAEQKIGRHGWVKYRINSNVIAQIKQSEFFILGKRK